MLTRTEMNHTINTLRDAINTFYSLIPFDLIRKLTLLTLTALSGYHDENDATREQERKQLIHQYTKIMKDHSTEIYEMTTAFNTMNRAFKQSFDVQPIFGVNNVQDIEIFNLHLQFFDQDKINANPQIQQDIINVCVSSGLFSKEVSYDGVNGIYRCDYCCNIPSLEFNENYRAFWAYCDKLDKEFTSLLNDVFKNKHDFDYANAIQCHYTEAMHALNAEQKALNELYDKVDVWDRVAIE